MPRYGFVICLCGLVAGQLLVADALGQRYKQSRRRPAPSVLDPPNQSPPPDLAQTQASTQQSPATATNPPQSQAAPPRSNSQPSGPRFDPLRQAQRPTAARATTPGTAAAPRRTPGPAKVLEKADPETRAAFLKLMGASWIWSPAYPKDDVPVGDCYFRKTFRISQAEFAQVHVACDNQYELYVNGRLAGQGADWRKMDVHDILIYLLPGENVVAIKATNTDPGPAGLVARVVVKERGGTHESYSTDETWRTSVKHYLDWARPRVRDDQWLPAKVYGPLGGVLPWGDEVVIAEEGSRFLLDPEFTIERLVSDEQAGSLIAMAFNASGDILASRENGPLQLIRDVDRDGTLESVAPFCEELKNVQGILPLGNRVYVVGDGPAGVGLYQLSDADGDGRCDKVDQLVPFKGTTGEHGPHTVRLGPDGLLYVLSGNFSHAEVPIDPRSPYSTTYEGDLIRPRYEDPNGHAVGLAAPGGTIVRTDTSGSFVERVVGGFRNPYDFTFDADGELFTYDADMEWDMGAPWYRPTRLIHAPSGGEFGWRSGWAKWPEYYLDSLPATLDVGPGSPTGMVYYDHTAFPERLRKTLFVGDWATGQIHAVKLERHGATYKAKLSTFVKGRPLNVTGLDVGPDGALYICTGGRGTDGGIYRVRWNGSPKTPVVEFGRDLEQALRQPQMASDWARMRIAMVKRALNESWEPRLAALLKSSTAPATDRARALDLLTCFGPPPSAELLVEAARDKEPALRVRAARLMGLREDESLSAPLVMLLSDADPWVRRVACEAIAHRGSNVPTRTLVGLLGDRERFVAFAARRALERIPAAEWQQQVLASEDPQTFFQGATGLLVAHPSPQVARQILARCAAMIEGDVTEPGLRRGEMSDDRFLDLLRVSQLALERGEIDAGDASNLGQLLLREYPTKNALMNRELVRLLAYLQPAGAAPALAKQLDSNIPAVDKLQIGGYAPRIKEGWRTDDKMTMLRYYEEARGLEGGHSVRAYIENFARDFFVQLTADERRKLIAAGERFPASTLSVLAKLPDHPEPETFAELRALDQRLDGLAGEGVTRLRVGIVAVLGGSGDAESLDYLRNLYYSNPQRRAPVAMSLTQHPEGDNWPILVDSLRTAEGEPARTILAALAKVDRRPETSDPYRNTILLGLRLGSSGGELAARLLEKWIDMVPYAEGAPLDERLATWQEWYGDMFPDELPAELPKESQPNKWSYEELLSFLEGAEGQAGSPSRGAQAFHDAQCVSCHRFDGRGEGIGPDLTTVAQRFQRKEILESIVYPNQVVSDQYASEVVIAGGKTYTGIVARQTDGSLIVLQSDGQKTHVAAEDIEEVSPSKLSAMPEGLLNRLSLEQVADLFAYLMKSAEPNLAGRGASAAR